jgi:hypothetical protein
VIRALGLALLLAASAAPFEPGRARELLARLVSENEEARSTARFAISRSRDQTLLPALVDALFFAPLSGRADVVACLEEISGERLGSNYRY